MKACVAVAGVALALAACTTTRPLNPGAGAPRELPGGSAVRNPQASIVDAATAMRGQPYRYGGAAPGGRPGPGGGRFGRRQVTRDVVRLRRVLGLTPAPEGHVRGFAEVRVRVRVHWTLVRFDHTRLAQPRLSLTRRRRGGGRRRRIRLRSVRCCPAVIAYRFRLTRRFITSQLRPRHSVLTHHLSVTALGPST